MALGKFGYFTIRFQSDEPEFWVVVAHDVLEAHGYATIETRSGVEAVGLARKHRPDLIIMDIQLPEVSGMEVIQWLKDDDQLRHIPVIAITAYAMKGDELKMLAAGCDGYLSKPIDVATFANSVRGFLQAGARPTAQLP